jgi:hypothetical protein
MAAAAKQRNVHVEGLATSTAIAGYYVKNFIAPMEVIRVLNAAHVRFMLAGAHGIGGWLDEARATQDVDVVVGHRQHQKATRALVAAFPGLVVDDQEVVVRLMDPESGKVLIDIMKANQPLYREALKHTHTVEAEGHSYKIPSLEMALAMKFGPMVSIVRADAKKYRDASDFMLMVKANPNIDLELLAELGELVYSGGGKEIVEVVRKIRAGEKLQL